MHARDLSMCAANTAATQAEIASLRGTMSQMTRLYGAPDARLMMINHFHALAMQTFASDVDRAAVLHAAVDLIAGEDAHGCH